MKIKEAAAECGLTEKAIRLYEAKGLVEPEKTELNGRSFRSYSPENIRVLKQIGTLRRTAFSLEQIGEMLEHPERTSDIFLVCREAVREESGRLSALCALLDAVDEGMLDDPESLAAALSPEESPDSAPHIWRWRVWDEEISAAERARGYQDYLTRQERRARMDRLFAPAASAAAQAGAFLRRRGRLLAAVCVVLLVTLGALFNMPAIRSLTREGEGVLFSLSDSSLERSVAVRIEGVRSDTLLGERSCSAKFSLSGFHSANYSAPPEYRIGDGVRYALNLRAESSALAGSCVLCLDEPLNGVRYRIKRAYYDQELRRWILSLSRPALEEESGLYIAFPASSRDEALMLYGRLAQNGELSK